MSSTLFDAITVFKELGWNDANTDELEHLPIGTAEQRKIAVQGLEQGSLLGLNNVNRVNLRVFAIRAGVSAARAAELIDARFARSMALAVADRGEAFAQEVVEEVGAESTANIGYLCVNDPQLVSLWLLTQLYPELPVPASASYLTFWLNFASCELGFADKLTIFGDTERLPKFAEATLRFPEHLCAFAESRLPTPLLFAEVVETAYKKGIVSKEDVIAALCMVVEHSQRRTDIARCVKILGNSVQVSDRELLHHSSTILPAIEAAEPSVVRAFASRLLRCAAEPNIAAIGIGAMNSTAKKTKREAISALRDRTDLGRTTIAELFPEVSKLCQDPSPNIAKAARDLVASWKATGTDDNLLNQTANNEAAEGQNMQLRPTPPVWEIPRLERSTPTVDSVVAQARDTATNALTSDRATEEFLASIVELAWADRDGARRALSGVSVVKRCAPFAAWAKTNGLHVPECEHDFPIEARDVGIAHMLGQIPCVVSEPSFVDLSISVSDFLARIDVYADTDATVCDADLYLAMCRLVPVEAETDVTVLSALRSYRDCPVPVTVVESHSRKTSLTVGAVLTDVCAVIDAIDNPATTIRGALSQLTCMKNRLQIMRAYGFEPDFSILPRSGDLAYQSVRWERRLHPNRLAAMALQLAQCAQPLPPGATMNLIGLLRPTATGVDPRIAEAIFIAWERGLIRPGRADVRVLDWGGKQHVKPLMEPLRELAQAGLVTVVWPILDGFLEHSVPLGLSSVVVNVVVELLAECAESLCEPVVGKNSGEKSDSAAWQRVSGLRMVAESGARTKAVRNARNLLEKLGMG